VLLKRELSLIARGFRKTSDGKNRPDGKKFAMTISLPTRQDRKQKDDRAARGPTHEWKKTQLQISNAFSERSHARIFYGRETAACGKKDRVGF